MSTLGKNLLWAALVGAVVAVGALIALILQYNDTKTNLASTKQAVTVAQSEAKKAKDETATAEKAKETAEKDLADSKAKVDDLNTKLTEAQKKAQDASDAVSKATDAAKTAQDALDAIKKTLKGKSAEDIVANEAKAESDLAAAQSEKKILQDQLQTYQKQVADLTDAINRSTKQNGQMPGVSGKVTFVDRAWNFVILDVGLSNGVVPNGELIVYRGRSFLGKVKVTKVDPNDAVAEILPDIKGDIQIGDSVLN